MGELARLRLLAFAAAAVVLWLCGGLLPRTGEVLNRAPEHDTAARIIALDADGRIRDPMSFDAFFCPRGLEVAPDRCGAANAGYSPLHDARIVEHVLSGLSPADEGFEELQFVRRYLRIRGDGPTPPDCVLARCEARPR